MIKQHTLSHTIILITTVFCAYLLSRTFGGFYDLELTAGLFVIYIVLKRFLPHRTDQSGLSSHQHADAVMFTLIIVHLVESTGGLSSSFFFLVYFLLFALSLMLEPVTSATTAFSLVILFIVTSPLQLTPALLLPVMSLLFIVPFALFIGSEYKKREAQQKKIRSLETMESNVEKDALLFVSTVMRGHLRSLSETADNFHGDHELATIKRILRRMHKLIDTFEERY